MTVHPATVHPVALALARSLDPTLLADPVGLEPEPWQSRVLLSSAKRQIVDACRQSGKSTITALRAVHLALYRPGSLVLIVAPTLSQATELYRKVRAFYQSLGRPVPLVKENTTTMELENGSRIVAVPGNPESVRGFSAVALLIIDEAAFVSDELYMAVEPMVSVSQGTIIALSTPNGCQGWFWKAWHEESTTWEKTKITAYDCPRHTAEDLAKARLSLGAWRFEQEYLGEFRSTEDSVFSADLIAQMWTTNPALRALNL